MKEVYVDNFSSQQKLSKVILVGKTREVCVEPMTSFWRDNLVTWCKLRFAICQNMSSKSLYCQASVFESLCGNNQFYWPTFCLLFFHLSPQVALEGLRPSVPPGASSQMSKLVSICWNNDPTKRPRFDQIIPILGKMAQ